MTPEIWAQGARNCMPWFKRLAHYASKEQTPDYCFASLTSLERDLPTPIEIQAGLAKPYPWGTGAIIAVGTWLYSKSVYKFDPEMLTALVGTSLADNLPCEVLQRLPEYAVYVELPVDPACDDADPKLYGFWATVTYCARIKGPLLIMHLNTSLAHSRCLSCESSKASSFFMMA